MARTRSKRYEDQAEKIESENEYDVVEALNLVMDQATANFTESIDTHIRLGIDPEEADQQVRGSLELPSGTGREVRVIVFAQGEKKKEADEAGADEVGNEELIEKIQDGWMEFDQAIATPDMMSDVSALGPILGPRKLMPNNKAGTVTFDVAETVEKLKRGQIEVRNDSYGIIHTAIGTDEMSQDDLTQNFDELLNFLIDQRPPGMADQGQYFKSITISPTMGPSIKISSSNIWSRLG